MTLTLFTLFLSSFALLSFRCLSRISRFSRCFSLNSSASFFLFSLASFSASFLSCFSSFLRSFSSFSASFWSLNSSFSLASSSASSLNGSYVATCFLTRLLPSPMISAMAGSTSSGGASNPTALLQKSGSSKSTSFPSPPPVSATKLALLKLPKPLLNELVAPSPYVTVLELFSNN